MMTRTYTKRPFRRMRIGDECFIVGIGESVDGLVCVETDDPEAMRTYVHQCGKLTGRAFRTKKHNQWIKVTRYL